MKLNQNGVIASCCPGPIVAPSRRAFISGGLGAMLTLAIPGWQLMAEPAGVGATLRERAKRKPKACILLWMNGGPSHLDTFDPKPGTTVGGSFKAIDTAVKGVRISEHLPRVAEMADRLAIVRSMTSREGNHDRGQYLMHTGYIPTGTLAHPSMGAWVSHELGDARAELPNFVSVRGPSIGAGFFGVEHQPFVVQNPMEGVKNLPLAKDVDARRFDRRLAAIDLVQTSFAEQTGQPAVGAHGQVDAKAVRLMRSPLVKAFDLSQETEASRAMYSNSDFGRGCLLARRLVESGVKFVEVTLDGWDTHYNNFTAVKNLSGDLDPAMAGLIKDLEARGMLADTLVLWMGEFGRSPKISGNDGRDHHPGAWSAVMAGGGVRGGQAYGSTDAEGEKVAKDAVDVPDFFATIATLLGMNPEKEIMSPMGRPISMSDHGTAVRGLMKA